MSLKHKPGTGSGLADVDCYILMALYHSDRLKNCRGLLVFLSVGEDSDTSNRAHMNLWL